MTDDAPRAEVACGEWSKPRRFAACPWMTRPRERPCRTVCVDLFQDGPQRVNPGGPEPVLPTGLPCELHSSPDWAWRSPGKQNGDPRHSCSDAEFTIATRPRPRRTRREVTNHESSLPPRPPQQTRSERSSEARRYWSAFSPIGLGCFGALPLPPLRSICSGWSCSALGGEEGSGSGFAARAWFFFFALFAFFAGVPPCGSVWCSGESASALSEVLLAVDRSGRASFGLGCETPG